MRSIVFLLSTTLYCFALEYAVVSSTKIQSLSKSQIKAIFLKKLTHLDGVHIIPVNLPYNNSLRSSFENELLKMGESRLKSYWSQQHYLGNRPPIIMNSQESTFKFIENVEGGISYMLSKNVNNSVNVLYRWESNSE